MEYVSESYGRLKKAKPRKAVAERLRQRTRHKGKQLPFFISTFVRFRCVDVLFLRRDFLRLHLNAFVGLNKALLCEH
jgi:hypothetical protein